MPHVGDAGRGINRQMPHVGNAGRGINRKMPHVGDAGRGINRQMPHVGDAGRGINRQMPHVGDAGQGINRQMPHVGDAGRGAFIEEWFGTLAARLRDVRVLSGDWTRCLTESLTTRHGVTGAIPRPALRRRDRADPRLRRRLRHRLRRRAPLVPSRTATTAASASPLCGYEGEGHDALLDYGWTAHAWSAAGGYGGGRGRQGRREPAPRADLLPRPRVST